MIEYDYRCEDCDNTWELVREMDDRNLPVKCPKCKSGSTCRDFSAGSRTFVFEPMYYDHIDVEPILITSKKHLKAECDKRGLVAHRLD